MHKIISLLILFFTSLHGFSQNPPDLILKNVNIIPISENKVINKTSIAITNGIITEINDFDKIKVGEKTVIHIFENKFIMPGLSEMHSHLPLPEKIDTYLIANVAAGVTHLRVMNTEVSIFEMKDLILSKEIAPKLFYPYIITKDLSFSTEKQMDSLVLSIKKNGYDFIKLFSIASEPMFDWLMKSANKQKIIVCGHYPSMVNPDKVVSSGFKSIEHLGGYVKIKKGIQLDSIIKLTQKYAVFNCPTLDWDYVAADLMLMDDYKQRLMFETAPQHFIDDWNTRLENYIIKEGKTKLLKGKEDYLPTFNYKMEILKKLSDAGNLLLLGSDPGGLYQLDGFNLYEEMVHWSKAGITNYDILRATTINPAKFFNEEKKWGTIEVGKEADFIILDKNPLEDIKNMKTVEVTIINGKLFWKKELLDKI